MTNLGVTTRNRSWRTARSCADARSLGGVSDNIDDQEERDGES
jgi:hypothetical protein